MEGPMPADTLTIPEQYRAYMAATSPEPQRTPTPLPSWKDPALVRRRERAELRAALLHIATSPAACWMGVGVLLIVYAWLAGAFS
jgi:hypothetical protein